MDSEFVEFLQIAERAEIPHAPEAVGLFVNWIKSNEYEWSKITAAQAREYKDYLLVQEFSATYARKVLITIKNFYAWYFGTDGLSPFWQVFISVKKPRGRPGPKPYKKWILSTRQIDLLRAAIGRLYTTQLDFYRASLVLFLPLYMGISYEEACRMLVDDLRGEGAYLHREDRTIPYAAPLRMLATQYLSARASKTHPLNPYLFPNPSDSHMTVGSMRKLVSRIAEECGVRTSEEILLDTFAYNLAVDGAPVGLIATLRNCPLKRAEEFISLASESDDITKVYLRSVEQRMRPVKRRVRVRRVD